MFAELYRNNGDYKNANLIYHKASKVTFRLAEEQTNLWASWVEMHLKDKNY